MRRTHRLVARAGALAATGAASGYLIANSYVSHRFGGALTHFDPLFLGSNVVPIYERAPEEFWTSAVIISGSTAFLPMVPLILTAGRRAREAATRAKRDGHTLDPRRRAVASAMAFGAFGAVTGYVIASAYVTYRFGGSLNHIDFTFLARNAVAIYERAPQTFWTAASIIGALTVVPLGMISALTLNEKLTTYGTTNFQTPSEIKKNGFLTEPGHGFLLGKLGAPRTREPFIVSREFPHALMIAPTGRGKGVGFVIPNLLIFKGSVVVLDLKGENFVATARHRVSMGDRVIRFAPMDWSRRSHRYNPLQRISALKNPHQRMMALKKIGRQLLQAEEGVKGLLDGGLDIFTACGLLAFERGTPTIGAIYELASAGGDKKKAYSELALEVKYRPAKIIFERLGSINDKTLTSYLSVLMTSGLELWSNPHIQNVTSCSDFSFSDIRRNPHAIYFEVPLSEIEDVAPLARLFFGDLIATLETKEPGDDEPGAVMIVLDEFHKLGKIPIVAESIATLRSFGGHLAVITQSIPQIDEVYGKNMRLVLQAGAGVKTYFTPSDELTVAEVSALMGKTTRRVISKSRPLGMSPLRSRSVSERTEEAPLMSEDQVRRMDLDDVVIVTDAAMPIRARRLVYHEDPVLNAIHKAQKGELPWPPVFTEAELTPPAPPTPDHPVGTSNKPMPLVPSSLDTAVKVIEQTSVAGDARVAGAVSSPPQPTPTDPLPTPVALAAPVEQAASAVLVPSARRAALREGMVASARRAALRHARSIAFIQPLDTVIPPEVVAAIRQSIRRIRALQDHPAMDPPVSASPAGVLVSVPSVRRAGVRRSKTISFIKPRDAFIRPDQATAIRAANGKITTLEGLLAADLDSLAP